LIEMSSKKVPKIRLFTGVELPPEIRLKIAGLARTLSRSVEGVRWVPEENLHVTLKFLGWCEIGVVDDVVRLMQRSTVDLPAEIEVGGLGGFPSHRSARVVWVGVEDIDGRLSRVYDSLNLRSSRIGFESEKRRYSPHVTVGRARKKPVSLPDSALEGEGWRETFTVEEIALFQSELRTDGAVYTVLERVGPRSGGRETRG